MMTAIKLLVLFAFFSILSIPAVWAMDHEAQNGLLRVSIPESWHWHEYEGTIIITYPDDKNMAMEIQTVPLKKLPAAEIKRIFKEDNDKMVQGVLEHQGTITDRKLVTLGKVPATRIDFQTSPPDPMSVTYISCLYKGYTMTVTYGTTDEKMHEVLDDAVASLVFE